MAINVGRKYQRNLRGQEGQFRIDENDTAQCQQLGNARKAVSQGDPERAFDILGLEQTIEMVDTTPADLPEEKTVEMEKGRKKVEVAYKLVKLYQKDGWMLC